MTPTQTTRISYIASMRVISATVLAREVRGVVRPYTTRSASVAYKRAKACGGQAFRLDGSDVYFVRVQS